MTNIKSNALNIESPSLLPLTMTKVSKGGMTAYPVGSQRSEMCRMPESMLGRPMNMSCFVV